MESYDFGKILYDVHKSANIDLAFISEKIPSYGKLRQKICHDYGSIDKAYFEDQIIAKVHDEKEFSKWQDFEHRIFHSTGLETNGNTIGAYPCYNSYCVVEKNDYEWGGMRKILVLKKSFVGNYFVLYGVDSSFFRDESGKYAKSYGKRHAFTFSPVNDYKVPFLKVEKLVRSEFPGIRIIPGILIDFFIVNSCSNSVYSILFDEDFMERVKFIGDVKYGLSDWKI